MARHAGGPFFVEFTPMSETSPAPSLSLQQRLVILSVASATYLGASMSGAVSLVLPRIAADLHFTTAQVQWVIAGYLLARIAALRPAGGLCDTFGPRKVYLFGMAGFALASLMCALADTELWLITARVLQGTFGAMLSPAALVLLRLLVPASAQAYAMSIWSAAGMAGFGFSPVLGGVLVAYSGWRMLFIFTSLVALLIAVAAVWLLRGPMPVASTPAQAPIKQEIGLSVVLAAAAFFSVERDWLALLGILILACMLMVAVKRTAILRADFWRPGFRMIPQIACGVLGFASMTGGMIWASYFIQIDLHHSAMVFGIGCLPMALAGLAACFGSEPLLAANRQGLALLLAGVSALLFAMLSFYAQSNASLIVAIGALTFTGLCYGFVNGAVTALMINAVPTAESGGASSIATLSKQFGQLLGITVIASTRDLSGKTTQVDDALFYFLASCGVMLAVFSVLRMRQEESRRLAFDQGRP